MNHEEVVVGGLYRITPDDDSYSNLRVRVTEVHVDKGVTIAFIDQPAEGAIDGEYWEAQWLEPVPPLEQLAGAAE